MHKSLRIPLIVALACPLVVCPLLAAEHASGTDKQKGADWMTSFPVNKGDLSSVGRNPYFILEPGYYLMLAGDEEKLTITVLNETKKVDGVETRVVEERETNNGKLVEVSRNYFAINKRTHDVFYFGEDVDMYKGGKVSSHEGAWQSGVNGAKFGLMMPGRVALKTRAYQEMAPGTAMDRAEIVSLKETLQTPAGTFKNCLKTEETTPLEPKTKEYKFYSRGIGLIQDGDVKLVKYGRLNKR